MKNRQGHVRNSSSSSFIVGFTEEPQSVADMHRLLFDNADLYFSSYDEDSATWPARDVAEIVYADMRRLPATREKLIEALMDGYFDGYPEHEPSQAVEFRRAMQDSGLDIYSDSPEAKIALDQFYLLVREENKLEHAKIRKAAEELLDKFMASCDANTKFYTFSYGDESGRMESAMEHGGLFDKLPHLTISNH